MRKNLALALAAAMSLSSQAISAQSDTFDAEKYLIERDTRPTPEEALSSYVDGAQFGAWYVEKENDEMSPTAIVAMVTPAERLSKGEPTGRFGYFGIRFIGPINPLILAKSYGRGWPYCDFNLASISIDGEKAIYIAAAPDPGYCNKIALGGSTVRQMKAGTSAKVRLNGGDYVISLEGFSAALVHAQRLAR